MKVVVFMEYVDYEGGYLSGAVIVPDDFDYKTSIKQWREETFEHRKWKNGYGEGIGPRKMTIPYYDWLREKHGTPEVIEHEL